MAYDIYGCYLKPGHCEVHPDVPERYPCYLCYQEQQLETPPEQEYPVEEICASQGHSYYGDDEEGGRCYCGEKRYPHGTKEEEGLKWTLKR